MADIVTPRDWTADQITRGIALAVKEHDFEAVVALLKMLALKDPRQAGIVHQSMLAAIERAADG